MEKKWWKNFFDESYLDYATCKTQEEIAKSADFIIDTLKLEKNSILYDQCCGVWDISIALATKGVKCIGLDQSEKYIEIANKRAEEGNLNCSFFSWDAFTYKTEQLCDAAVNWYTSFGYSVDDNQNIKMIKNIYDSLKPWWKFLLDYYNSEYILANFKETIEYEVLVWSKLINMRKKTKIEDGIMKSWWLYENGKEYYGESRFYSLDDLQKMMERIWFRVIEIYGTEDWQKYDKSSRRCILVGVK